MTEPEQWGKGLTRDFSGVFPELKKGRNFTISAEPVVIEEPTFKSVVLNKIKRFASLLVWNIRCALHFKRR